MFQVRSLIISAFASGFGLCSVFFAFFTMTARLSFLTFFQFLLTISFFVINFIFTIRTYNIIAKQLNIKSKSKAKNTRLSDH
jgi:hypothetical protein